MGKKQLGKGEKHPFLVAESRSKIRKAPPQKHESTLVDLNIWDRVPTPGHIQNGNVWHRPAKPTALERKIEVARKSVQSNPTWQRRHAAMQQPEQKSAWLRGTSPRHERPMSSSYKQRYKDERLNFDTGIAKMSTTHLREKQALYYAPTSGSSHLPADKFKRTLRHYPYMDGTEIRKLHERQQERQWRRESRDSQRHQGVDFEELSRLGSSQMQPSREFGSIPVNQEEGQRQERKLRRPVETVPVEEIECLKVIYPEGLDRIKQRSMRPKREPQIQRLQTIGPSTGTLVEAELLSPDARVGTPQLKMSSSTAESRHQILLGLENADLRDTYYNDGHPGVERLISKKFSVVPDADDREDWNFLSSAGETKPEAIGKAPRSSRQRNKPVAGPKARHGAEEKADGMEGSAPYQSHMSVVAANEESADGFPPSTLTGDTGQEDFQTRASNLRTPLDSDVREGGDKTADPENPKPRSQSPKRRIPSKSDPHTSIFKVLAYQTITRDEIPDEAPVWLSYTVHHEGPQEEEPTNPAAYLGWLRKKMGIPDSATAVSEEAGDCSNGRSRRHGWRKGAVTLRKLDVPVELEEAGALPVWFDDSQASANC